jgi:AcrR family transcriptional regulator
MTTDTTARPMRADARRNREALLHAAGELFAEKGTDVSLEAIAARAGVGIGTLYRNFPNREMLVEAAYRTEVEQLCAAAAELLAGHRADVALAEWMDRFVTYTATKRGMSSALQSISANSDLRSEVRTQIVRAIGELLAAGAVDGTLRSDVDAADVQRAMGAIWNVGDGPEWRAQAETIIRLLVDGLRHGARQ